VGKDNPDNPKKVIRTQSFKLQELLFNLDI